MFLGAALYGFQVYIDFSGGMDITRGIAQILGIDMDRKLCPALFCPIPGGILEKMAYYLRSLDAGLRLLSDLAVRRLLKARKAYQKMVRDTDRKNDTDLSGYVHHLSSGGNLAWSRMEVCGVRSLETRPSSHPASS